MARPRKDAGSFFEEQPVSENTEKTYSEEQVQDMIVKAVAEAMARQKANMDEMVTVLYLDEVNPDSELKLDGYGSMKPNTYIEVPKKEFGNKFMSGLVRKLIGQRKLIVTNGLTKDERERWNCDYKSGEVLDEMSFDKMLDYSTEQLESIFKNLCPEHQRFIATRMITAKENGDNRVSLSKAQRLNELSKATDPAGMFKPVLDAFGNDIRG